MAAGSEEVSNTNTNTNTNTDTDTGASTSTSTNPEVSKWLDNLFNTDDVPSEESVIRLDDKRYLCMDCGWHTLTESEKEIYHGGHEVYEFTGSMSDQLNFANSVEIKNHFINQEKVIIISDNNQEENVNVNDQEFKKHEEEGISISEDEKKAKIPLTEGLIKDMIKAEFFTSQGAPGTDKNNFCFKCGGHALTESQRKEHHESHAVIKAEKAKMIYGFPLEDLKELVSGLDMISGIAKHTGRRHRSLIYQKGLPKKGKPKSIKSGKYCVTCNMFLSGAGGRSFYCSLSCKFNNSAGDQMKVASDMEGKEVSKGPDSHITKPVIIKTDKDVNNQKEGCSDNQQERNFADGGMRTKAVDDDGDSAGVSDVKKRKTGDSEETESPPRSEPSY